MTILYASDSKCASANLTRKASRARTRGSSMLIGLLSSVVPFTTDLAGSPRARAQAARLARARGRAALCALNDADRPGWRQRTAIGCPRPVLVCEAASGGGSTTIGPGPRWRPLSRTAGCAARSGTRTGSSLGLERRGSTRMATKSGDWGPASGAGARGGQQRRGDYHRPWTSLAAPGPEHRLRGSLGHSDQELSGLRTTRINPDGDQQWPSGAHVGCSCAWRPAAAEGPPSALDVAGGPRARPKAALLARTHGRAAPGL